MGRALPEAYRQLERTGLTERRLFKRLYGPLYFAYKRHAEDPFSNLTKRRPELLKDGHVIDVGANIGYTSSVFARAASPGFTIFAFEPEAANFAALNDNLAALIRSGRVVPIRAAVGEAEGEIDLWVNRQQPSDHRVLTAVFRDTMIVKSPEAQRVPVRSIDSFLAEKQPRGRVGFVKIDVQGFEVPALRGMEKLLASDSNTVFAVEYAPEMIKEMGFDPEEIPKTFEQNGQKLYILPQSAALEPYTLERVNAHLAQRGYVDLIAARQAL